MKNPNPTKQGNYCESLFKENQSVMLIIDPVSGDIKDANRAACEFYGYTLDQLLSINIGDINMLPADEVQRIIQTVLDGSCQHLFLKHRLSNGDTRDVEVYSGKIKVDNSLLIYSMVRDITDAKRAESQLRESEERWKFALSEATDGVWDFNVQENTVYYSPQWKAMLGYESDEISCAMHEWSSRVHPEDLRRTLRTIRNHQNGITDSYRCEYRLRCKNGSYIWILDEGKVVSRDADGAPLRFIGTHKDITERVRTDHELRERLKEIKCHNLVSELLSKPHQTIDSVCQKIAQLLPSGWQYPEFASACIVVNQKSYLSDNYKPSDISLRQAITLNDEEIGCIEVCYSEEPDNKDYPVFLAEETDLLFAIAVKIANFIENQQAQAQLKRTKEKYENLINNINDAICEMDENGVFLFVSPIIEKILGYKPEEIEGRKFEEFTGLNSATVKERFIELQSKKFSENEYQIPAKDGQTKWVIISAKASITDGKFAGLTATMKDITEAKLAQHEQRKTELLYQSFITASNDSLAITDLNGIVEYASPRTNIMFGYDPYYSFVGHSMMEFIHPSNYEMAAQRLSEMFQRSYGAHHDYTGLKANGKEFDIEVVGGFIDDDNGNHIKMIFNTRDVSERRAAQRAIKESEEKYQKAFSTAPYAIAIHTIEYGLFIDVNETFTSYFDFKREELVHRSGIELNMWVNIDDRKEIVKTLKAGDNVVNKEVQFRKKSGELFTGLFSGSTIMLNDKKVILSNIIDITDKKENEQRIKTQNERLAAMIKAIPDLLFVMDNQGVYLEAYCSNPELLLIPVEDIPGNNIRNIFSPQDADFHLKKLKECTEQQKVITYQYTLGTGDSTEYFESRLAPMGSEKVLSLIRNITEQIRKEDEIRKLQIAVEQSPVSIVMTDLEAKIEYVNQAFTEITGYSRKELMGTHTRLLKHSSTAPSIYTAMWSKITKGETWKGEWLIRKKNGDSIWEDVSISPIINSKGAIVSYLAIKQDISARKKAEQEILELNSSLEKRIKERTKLLEQTNQRLKKEIVERVRIEQELSESEKNYRSVVENIKEVIFKTDAEGLWIFLNKAWEEITGFSVDESVGQLFLNYVHPDDRQLNAELFAPLISREKDYCRHQIRYLTKNGGYRWIEVFARLGIDENDNIVGTYGTLQDITERKMQEEAILWNQSLMQLMAGSSPFGFLVVDNRTDEIIYFNQRFCEIWNIEELSGRMLNGELKNNDIIPYCIPVLEDVEAFAASCTPLQDEDNRVVINDEIKFTNNRTIRRYSTQIRGVGDQYFGRFYIFEDITEQKRAEAFEKELLNLSPRLTGTSMAEIDTAIKLGISRIGEFLSADRSYIFEIDFEKMRLHNTYEWCADGIAPQLDKFNDVAFNTFNHTIDKLLKFENVEIPSVEDLAADWGEVKDILLAQQVQSLLVIPLIIDNKLIGFVGLDSIRQKRAYTTAEINIMKVWSSLLSGLINNQRANNLLEATRLNYETFFNTIDDFLFVLDRSGNIVLTNDTVKERLGYDDTELINQSVLYVHPEDRREEAARIVQEMLTGKADYCPVPLIKKNGELISVETRVKSGFWNNQQVLFGVSKDISQIKLSEQKFSSAFHSNSSLMAITEISTGRFIDVNESFLKTFEYEREEVIGKTAAELKLYQNLEDSVYISEHLRNNEKIIDYEMINVSKTGELIVGLFSAENIYVGKDLCSMGSLVNISKRKKAEAELSIKTGFLSDLLQSIPDIVFYKDLEGKYIGCNSEFCKFLGKEMHEIIGFNDYELFDKKVADGFRHYDSIVLSKNEAMHNDEWITYPDGSKRMIDTYKAPLRNSAGEIHGLLGISRDITYRKQFENQLNEAKLEADRANLAKSEFLSRMSHELRTPMNSILGFAQLLELGQLTPNQNKGVKYIMNSGKHLLELINEVLDISRIEAGHLSLTKENILLNDFLGEIIESVTPLAQTRNIVIKNNLTTDHPLTVKADSVRLKQVIINLLNNSIKYNRENGQIFISAEQISDTRKRQMIRLSVSDTGMGISADNLSKIFTPFERIGADLTSIEGTGLGLSLAKKLTEAMSGHIGVRSELGIGSTFWVELPAGTNQLTVRQKIHSDVQAGDANIELKGKILYVEDNQMNIDLVEDIIYSQRPNIKLITTVMGKMAVSLAKRHKPDIILLDINLPDIHGDEVLKQLLNTDETKHIPVIILSADAMDTQINSLLKKGASDYLTKPIDIKMFVSIIDQYINSKNQ